QMLVDLRDGGRIPMPHEQRAGERIDSRFQGTVQPRMTKVVETELLADLILQTAEAAVYGEWRPWPPLCVAEQRSLRVFQHEPARDFQGVLGEVHDAGHLLALTFVGRKHPTGIPDVNMSGLDP